MIEQENKKTEGDESTNNTNAYGDFLQTIEKEIRRVDDKADRYRNWFYLARILLIAIAFFITILSGLQGDMLDAVAVSNIILILGTLTTSFTAIDTLFQVETKKNVYKLMLVELREIRRELNYYAKRSAAEGESRIKDHLFPRYQSVMSYSRSLIENDKSNKTPQ